MSCVFLWSSKFETVVQLFHTNGQILTSIKAQYALCIILNHFQEHEQEQRERRTNQILGTLIFKLIFCHAFFFQHN